MAKYFYDEESGKNRRFTGEVIGYDDSERWYLVRYEDGDEEELSGSDLALLIVNPATKQVPRMPPECAIPYSRSEEKPAFSLPFFGGGEGDGPSLSMADVKKYGVAGTVAYVLTELAFWIVAFPAAAYALYQSTGHWPDVLNDNTDRAAVLGFIFAGANIARAFVPVRLGAALALAPWVDENLLSGKGQAEAGAAEKAAKS